MQRLQSLHMSEDYVGELGYNYFEGNDKPGDFRKKGTEFVPMEWVSDVNFLSDPSERPIYYDNSTELSTIIIVYWSLTRVR